MTPPDALAGVHEEYLRAIENYDLAAGALEDMLELQIQELIDRETP